MIHAPEASSKLLVRSEEKSSTIKASLNYVNAIRPMTSPKACEHLPFEPCE
jgi:hypothetical protein